MHYLFNISFLIGIKTMIKKLLEHIGEYKLDSILSPVFVTLEALLEVFIPYLMALIIDNGVTGGDMNYVTKMGIVLVGAALLSLLFGVLSGKFAARASAGFARNLRRALFYNVQSFSFSNIDKFSQSSLITRLTTDVTNVQNAYQMIIRIMVRSPALLILSLVMAFNINGELSLVFVFILPVLIIGLVLIMRSARPIFMRVFKKYDKMNNVVQENLRGIRVVKSYVREDFEIKKFEDVSEDIYKDFSKVEKMLMLTSPLMMFAVYASMLLLSWIGANLIVSETLQTGELMSLFTYTMQILMALMMFSMVLVMVIMARASAERIVEVLDEKSDLQNPKHPVMEVGDGSIRFEGVDFSYTGDKEHPCFRHASLNIKSGQVIGIIGGTGSGKTTLVQLIPRLYDVTGGTVFVGGKDVREYDLTVLRDSVSMVLQNNVLFSGTIKENLRWGNKDATDEELMEACKLAQADEFIRRFPKGYDTYIEQGGTNVSGGQKQRICIARALLKDPKILILDDSTSAVDMKTDALIKEGLRESIPGTTKIVIAQRAQSVMEADQIIVMDGGQINQIGTHAELLKTNTIYQEVYNSQTKGGGLGDAS